MFNHRSGLSPARLLASALVSIVAFSGAAKAADVLPPPAPINPPRYMAPAEFSGWYLRGDVGVSSMRDSKWSNPATPGLTNERIVNTSLTDPAIIGAGLGFQFNSWLRADVTGEYRGAVAARGTYMGLLNPAPATPGLNTNTAACTLLGTTGNCTLYQNQYAGSLSSMVLLANGYVDLGTWWSLTPYIGAGVGVARNSTYGFTDAGVTVNGTGLNQNGLPVVGGVATAGGPTSTVAASSVRSRANYAFAWALMTGLAYEVSPNLKLEMGYRYLSYGAATTGLVDCMCAQTFAGFKIANLGSHDMRLGMRWMFADAAPAPTTVFQPLVRKY